ncbi:zinc finger, C3HC4 type [Ostertagia ostertagi]
MQSSSTLLLRDDILKPQTSEEVHRFIILDAPNLMHMTKTKESEQNKVSVAGLLAVMRYFFKNDFDVLAVSQRKYTRDATVSHKFAVDQLETMGLMYLAEGHTLDDVVALEMAYTTDGVVVSNDQFLWVLNIEFNLFFSALVLTRDHMQLSQRFCNLGDRCVSIALEQVKPSDRYTMSSNGHYIAEHTFRFHRRPSSQSSFNFQTSSGPHGAFFSTPNNIRHEIVKEHRQNWTTDYRDQTISMIDEMLTKIRKQFTVFKARRSQATKKKAAVGHRESSNRYMSPKIIQDANETSKVTCFFDESLLACDICLEVMHNAMNVSPCNHKFCAGCIYEWNSLNSKCPKCRWSAVDITRDTTINAIIEQYLQAFPEKRRDEAQLIELDERELDHLEKWERKRDSDEGDYEYDMDDQYFEVST